MKFLCGSCRTKYQISDQKVRGKILTIRCKKCGSKILVRESLERSGGTPVAPLADEPRSPGRELRQPVAVAPPTSGARLGGSAALASAFDVAMGSMAEADDVPTSIAPIPANLDHAGVEWYVAIDGDQSGPFAFAEIVRKVVSRAVQGRHYAWHDGMENWTRIRDVSDLASYLPAEKKRRPPPPPVPSGEHKKPTSGAEVVDFARERAERERRRTGDLSSQDIEASVPSEAFTEGSVGTAPPSERAEQLDKVLNEALGIEGEDATMRAEASSGPIAIAATARVGEPGETAEDLLSFTATDDLFANLPRAGEDGPVESTRFFVAAAGVNQQRSRARVGMYAGLAGVLLVVAFVGAWAGGIIRLSIPGIGNPFAGGESEASLYEGDGDLSAAELAILKDKKKKSVASKQQKKRRTTRSRYSGYVNDRQNGSSKGTRGGGDTESISIDGELKSAGGRTGRSIGDAQLPSSGDLEHLVPDKDTLSAGDIQRVVNSRKQSVSICYTRSLRAREDLKGKLEIGITVAPSGRVVKAIVETSAFKGSRIGRCISEKIRMWRFPSFSGGQPEYFVVPFVLEKQSY